jgi:hypothetical protein
MKEHFPCNDSGYQPFGVIYRNPYSVMRIDFPS